ncbi:MAG: hypothetical protein H0Z38_01850 [Firmicutes bacterium]|nr:hypothetical protein [Bacillota bacterium]
MAHHLELETSLETASFVSSFYKLVGAKVLFEDKVLKVSLDDATAKRLDGPWARGYELTFVFHDEDVGEHSDAELVTMGSYRVHYLVQQAIKRGRFTKIALSPACITPALPDGPGNCRYYQLKTARNYLPYLAISFNCAFVGASRWEEIATLAVDRISGEVYELNWARLLPYISAYRPEQHSPLQKAELSFCRSYRILEKALVKRLTQRDRQWSEKAKTRLKKEQSDLSQYFAKLAEEAMYADSKAKGELERMKALRLQEQEERFAPRVYLRPVQAALIAIPRLETTYLKAQAGREEQIKVIDTPFSRRF